MLTKRLLKTSNYVVLEGDFRVGMDATAGSRDLTLPDVDADRDYILDKDDASANPVNVKAPAGGSINGVSQIVLANRYDAIHVVSMGSKLYRVLSKSLVAGESTYVQTIGSLDASLDVDFPFVPSLIEARWALGTGGYGSVGWARAAGPANQGCIIRRGADNLLILVNGLVGHHNGSYWTCGALGTTVTLTRAAGGDTLLGVVIIAHK